MPASSGAGRPRSRRSGTDPPCDRHLTSSIVASGVGDAGAFPSTEDEIGTDGVSGGKQLLDPSEVGWSRSSARSEGRKMRGNRSSRHVPRCGEGRGGSTERRRRSHRPMVGRAGSTPSLGRRRGRDEGGDDCWSGGLGRRARRRRTLARSANRPRAAAARWRTPRRSALFSVHQSRADELDGEGLVLRRPGDLGGIDHDRTRLDADVVEEHATRRVAVAATHGLDDRIRLDLVAANHDPAATGNRDRIGREWS